MAKMSGAGAVVELLRAEGVSHVFGLPGVQVLSIIDVLRETPDVRFVLSRHEQGAAYMALGWARATGSPGVCLSTAGPGATNLVTGVAGAFKGNAPMVAISGKQGRAMLERDVTQELDQTSLFKPITKWSYMATNVEKIPETVRRAFRLATTGTRGPVHIQFPQDILSQETEVEVQPPARYRSDHRPPCSPEQVRAAIGLLEQASAPVLLAGRQVLDDGATSLLMQLAQRCNLPVATMCTNLDAFPTTHPMGLGPIGRNGWPAANRLIAEADVMVMLGRFDWFTTGFTYDILSPRTRIIQVCANPEQIGAVYPVELGIVGSTDSFLSQLLELDASVPGNPADLATARAEWEAIRARQADPASSPVKVQHVVRTLRRLLDRDAVTVVDGGNFAKHYFYHWDTYGPNTVYITDNHHGVGSSVPSAIGVKLARPDRQVVNLCGDCGFMMNVGELETAVRERVNLVTLVLNDFGMGNNRAYQKSNFGGQLFADSYTNPDFGKLAELFGAWGCQVRRGEEVEGALRAALAAGKTAVVDIHIDQQDLASVVFKR